MKSPYHSEKYDLSKTFAEFKFSRSLLEKNNYFFQIGKLRRLA